MASDSSAPLALGLGAAADLFIAVSEIAARSH
jgi:hypothetical protein